MKTKLERLNFESIFIPKFVFTHQIIPLKTEKKKFFKRTISQNEIQPSLPCKQPAHDATDRKKGNRAELAVISINTR